MRNAASVADRDCIATSRMVMTKLLAFSTSEWTRYVLFHSRAKISEINCRRKLESIERQYVCICVNCFRVTKPEMSIEVRFSVIVPIALMSLFLAENIH